MEDQSLAGVVKLNPRFFRPGSSCQSRCVNYVIGDGGIGDYICYMSALHWIAKNHPHVEGRVYCGDFFVEIAQNILQEFSPQWKVYERSALTKEKMAKRPTYGPMFRPVNCTGAHPLDLGFIYYANLTTPIDGNFYPKLDFSKVRGPNPVPAYAVMTPGSTTANRTMPAEAFNGIKDHLISLGITPFFLGSTKVAERTIKFDEGYNYEGGEDLRDQTTLLEAAAIMSTAKVVVGLDNGLLHLAGCTEVPIVFGYNIASPEHRQPRRLKGLIRQIYPDPKQLTCTFCQSQMRFMFNHDFATCVYKDNLCLDALGDPKPWCDLIDEILAESDANSLPSKG